MLEQPFYRFYMNEALRKKKMSEAKEQVSYKFYWTLNFGLGLVISNLLLKIPMRYAFRRSGGIVPFIREPKFIEWVQHSPNQFRDFKRAKLNLLISIVFAYGYASLFTDASTFADSFCEDKGVIADAF